MQLKRAAILSLLVVWIVGMQTARADNGLLVIGGGATAHERTVVGGAIEGAVRKAGWTLPNKPLSKKESDNLLNCPDSTAPWTCVPASMSAKDVRNVFVVSIDSSQAENGAHVVVITGKMIVTDPPAFTVRQRFCERCADDKLGEAGEDLTQQLVNFLAARSGRTIVSIASMPSGADVILDGERVGATDSKFNTFPGSHLVIVQKAGYISETREFIIEDGKTAELAFKLRVSDTPPLRHSRPVSHSSRAVPLVAIGGGSALVAFGAISIYRGQVHSDDGKFRYSNATLEGGLICAVGLGAVGTGLYLLWRDSNNSVQSAPRTPTVGITSDGAVLGWMGRF